MAEFTKERIIEDLKASTQNASGMFEISEDTICNLMSMLTYAAPQLPQPAVPGEIQKLKDGRGFKYVKDGVHYSVNYANGWNQCRAAMLQGADGTLTNEGTRNHPEDNLDMVDHSGDANEKGNSPAIPDWQAKAEKMAELHGSSFVLFRNGESPQCADPTKVIISFTDEGLGHGSAAPQQEAK